MIRSPPILFSTILLSSLSTSQPPICRPPCNLPLPPPISHWEDTPPSSSSAPHLLMAERVPPSGNGKDESFEKPQPNASSSSTSRVSVPPSQKLALHGDQYATIVVQIPKDQIYRVPPPENAAIVKRHHDPSKEKKPAWCKFMCLGIVFLHVFIILLIAGFYVSVEVMAEDPRFSVNRVVYNNKTKSHRPDYTITLRSQNPNSRLVIIYDKGEDDAFLKLMTQEIATASFPSSKQDEGSSKVFDLVFHGSKIELPEEIEESSKSKETKVHVNFSMTMDIPGRMKIRAFKKSMIFHVECDFTVDTLVKGTRVLSQECRTSRK